MKIQLTHFGTKYSIEFDHEDVTIDIMAENIFNLLVSAGYSDNCVANSFIATGEEFWEASQYLDKRK